MSEINPVETAFAVQRDTIERSREFVSQGFEQQRQFVEASLDALGEGERTQRRALAATERAVASYFDAFLRTHEQVEAQVGEAVEIDVE